jgi:DNA-binding NarL/FixJ family response regulator
MAKHGAVASETAAISAEELSGQDVDLLKLLACGLPMETVARRLNTSERTVRRRVKAICDRHGFRAPIQAVAWAAREGLV